MDDELQLQDHEFLYLRLVLDVNEARHLRYLCDLQGTRPTELIQEWVIERLQTHHNL